MFFNAKSPYSQHILQEHGPDDLVATTVSQFPLSHVVLDETGPIFFGEGDSEENELYLSTHLLVCVELVTYRTYLVIMKDMSTRSVIQGLETLQQLRGSLMNIVLDAHKFHMGLLNEKDQNRRTVLNRLL